MKLTKKVAEEVARNIIEDGFKGSLGNYDNSRIWFKVDSVDYTQNGFDTSKFEPKLLNIGADSFDRRVYGNGRKLGVGKLATALYCLYNYVEEPIDCANTNKLHKLTIQAINSPNRKRV